MRLDAFAFLWPFFSPAFFALSVWAGAFAFVQGPCLDTRTGLLPSFSYALKNVLLVSLLRTMHSYKAHLYQYKVAYMGGRGAFAEEAVKRLFLHGTWIPCSPLLETMQTVFEAVNNGEADFAVVPLQNTAGGAVDPHYDLLLRYPNLYIVKEVRPSFVLVVAISFREPFWVDGYPGSGRVRWHPLPL